jgi:ribosomal protein S18 acetylase RimI-like enzyme
MSEPLFRPMREEETASVIALWKRAGLIRPWNPPQDDIAEILSKENVDILVATSAGSVGAAIVVGHDGHRGWVYYLGVDPDLRQIGWGRQAMRAAEEWVRRQGIKKIQLIVRNSNTSVLAFYQALGYEEGEVVLMQKWLDPERERLYREAVDAH